MSVTVGTDKNFQADVLEAMLPVLVDFYSDRCSPCRHMAPILDELAEELQDQAKFVKVDVFDNPASSVHYGINAIPCLVVFRNGEELHRLVGIQSKESLRTALGL